MTPVEELTRVMAFRNRLVAYMNAILSSRTGLYASSMDDATSERLAAEQPWLAQEYGALFNVVNRWGGMSMGSRMAGITVVDVVADAIHNPHAISYDDVARLAAQHLDTVAGRLRAAAERYEERRAASPDAIFRLTSPVYWLTRLFALIRWLLATAWRRALTALGAVALVVIGGIASGWAGAVFGQ